MKNKKLRHTAKSLAPALGGLLLLICLFALLEQAHYTGDWSDDALLLIPASVVVAIAGFLMGDTLVKIDRSPDTETEEEK